LAQVSIDSATAFTLILSPMSFPTLLRESGASMSPARILVALSACTCGWGISVRLDAGPPRLAVVSSFFGKKDVTVSLPDLADDVRGYFFTGSRESVAAGLGWKVVTRAYHLEDGQEWSKLDTHGKYSLSSTNNSVRGLISCKFYKLNAHLLPELQDADMILWTDAAGAALRSLKHLTAKSSTERAAELLGNDDFVLERHEDRNRVEDEIGPAAVRASMKNHGGKGTIAKEMWQGYEIMRSQGFHDDVGLFRSEQFLFRVHSSAVRKAMAYWWTFIQDYTYRDQISWPWALKFNGANFKAPCKAKGGLGGSCLLKLL